MTRSLLFFLFLFASTQLSAQCDELFISEYVEGYANNKALEIYNPTDQAVDLSQYSIARFANGAVTAPPETETPSYMTQLPDVMLEPYDVYVIVIDLTDTADWDTQFDKPAWNGYNLIDTIFDEITGLPVTDSLGNVLIGPQYSEDGAAIFGTEYDEKYDLQCKADVFLNPEYSTNRTMYFNGNDAVALIKGNELATDGSNLIDVIGVIGEDPEVTIQEPAWVNEDGFWITRDRTLVRKPDVASGRKELSEVVFQLGGTFAGTEWLSYRKNSFEYLGIHRSACDPEAIADKYSCLSGPVAVVDVKPPIPYTIYPNPNTIGALVIEAEDKIYGIEILDLMGHKVLRTSETQNNDRVELDIDMLESGFYYVAVRFADSQVSFSKLIIPE